MLNIEKRLFKDSTLLILAQGFNKLVGFFYNVFLARILGVNNFGEYVLALSVFGLIGGVVDLGMNQWLVRRVALSSDNKIRSLEVLVSRYLAASVGFVGLLSYLLITGSNTERGGYILLAVLAVLPQVMGATMDAVAIGLRKFGVSAFSLIALSVVQLILGVWWTLWWGLNGSLVAFFVGQLSYGLILLFLVGGFKFRLQIRRKAVWEVFRESTPFGLLVVISMTYARLDTILLAVLKGSFDVGIYGAGYKFFEAVAIIPSAVGAATYPYFAKLHQEHPSRVQGEFMKIMTLLMILSVPIIVGYWLILPPLIKMILPSYVGSIEVIRVLALGIPFYFGRNVVSVYLLSKGEGLTRVVVLSFVILLINGVLNFGFIPKYGYMASAWVGVASEVAALLIYLSYIKIPKK